MSDVIERTDTRGRPGGHARRPGRDPRPPPVAAAQARRPGAPLLVVEDLAVRFSLPSGSVKAVDGVSFRLDDGEALGIAGESGCGKTTTALSLVRLLPANGRIRSGKIELFGIDLVPKTETQLARYRWREISIVFQGAMNALNPVRRVGRPDRRADRGPPGPAARVVAQAGRGAARPRRDPEEAGDRLPARAVGRHAPARDDRDGARLRPGDRDRRRADDRPRRHGPGADPPAARAAAAGPRAVADPDHPRPVGDRRDVRQGHGHVRRPGRRGGPGPPRVHGASPPVHPGAAGRLPQHPRRPADARGHPGHAARPAQPAARLPLRAALRVRDAGLHRGRAAGGHVRRRRPGRLPPLPDLRRADGRRGRRGTPRRAEVVGHDAVPHEHPGARRHSLPEPGSAA